MKTATMNLLPINARMSANAMVKEHVLVMVGAKEQQDLPEQSTPTIHTTPLMTHSNGTQRTMTIMKKSGSTAFSVTQNYMIPQRENLGSIRMAPVLTGMKTTVI
jgi:hypothetical protein